MAEGVWWIRMPLPFALDHINLWILADGDGFTLVEVMVAIFILGLVERTVFSVGRRLAGSFEQ